MDRNYTVSTRIKRPVEDVYRALIDKDAQEKYFTTRTSASLAEGRVIDWFWDHWGTNQVTVKSLEENRRIVLVLDSKNWAKTDPGYDVEVIFELEPLEDGGTRLSISEAGWKTDAPGLKASHENCGGWQHMACSLKAWLEHGIDLRE
jgi:uncharacterized protein YndB with AHSA1/START domain